MRFQILATTFFLFGLIGCGTQPASTPQAVDPLAVEGVIVTDDLAACRRAALRAGANVLYESPRGLLLTDRALSQGEMAGCSGLVTPNEKLALPAEATGQARNTAAKIADLIRLLNKSDIKADQFLQRFPEADGRNVKIAVLDTGVDLAHSMLQVTPNGSPKMLAAHDFSGQGDVAMEAVTLNGEEFTGADGKSYKFTGAQLTELKSGVFMGSSLIYSEDVSSGDKFQDIAVVTYLDASGARRGRMDLNANGDFGDDEELFDFAQSRKLIRLGDKGTLPASFNVSADGSRATVVFDDGGHGTHVSGIAAGYDPQGLVGIAPGAQIISAKIGDNRLAGGSTTTASMVLAIDYAVNQGAEVINMSYGIRAGANRGLSAIDQYVDKVALEDDVLFAVSAGNEGPGLLTVGTPAGATRAITNAAYLSSETAKSNYGYVNYEKDNMWFFSSIGPLFDGGFKPTLTAPGTALSSVPDFAGGHATYSGTSMSSPQVTGGLALLVSGAKANGLPTDRISITRAVYRSAVTIPNVTRIQQGHGLMNVDAAFGRLKIAKDEVPVEYDVRVVGNTTNTGTGKGIFYRGTTAPANVFTVQITPQFPKGTSEAERKKIRTFKLFHSSLIKTPETLYLTGTPRSFMVDLDPGIFATPTFQSTSISLMDTDTNQMVARVPVTIIVPKADPKGLEMAAEVEVGDVERVFFTVPAGVSSVQIDLDSDGPMIWGQLLDSEGRLVADLNDGDRLAPQVPLRAEANVPRSGIYELDIVAPAYNRATAKVAVRVRYHRLKFHRGIASAPGSYTVGIENHGEITRLKASAEVETDQRAQWVGVTGTDRIAIPFTLTKQDLEEYNSITFRVQTAQSVYDLMTDYPYYVLGPKDELVTSGGFQLDSSFTLAKGDLKEGDHKLIVVGAFTQAAPSSWGFRLTESWKRTQKATLVAAGRAVAVGQGQALNIDVESAPTAPNRLGLVGCVTVSALDALNRKIESQDYCD